MSTGDYLTVAEAAGILNVSTHHIYRAMHRGDLPAAQARSGHAHLLIPADAVAAYRAQRGEANLNDRLGMLRTGQVAAILGIAPHAVRTLCRRGMLAYTHGRGPRGQLRIFRASVERFLDQRYQTS